MMHNRTVQRRKAAKWRANSRSKKYGIPIEECYNLDDSIAWYILPRLRAFRKHTITYPSDMTYEEWMDMLDVMIEGFDLYCNKDMLDMTDKDVAKIDLALEHLSKRFWDLWW